MKPVQIGLVCSKRVNGTHINVRIIFLGKEEYLGNHIFNQKNSNSKIQFFLTIQFGISFRFCKNEQQQQQQQQQQPPPPPPQQQQQHEHVVAPPQKAL